MSVAHPGTGVTAAMSEADLASGHEASRNNSADMITFQPQLVR
jgi:hypothetical protein